MVRTSHVLALVNRSARLIHILIFLSFPDFSHAVMTRSTFNYKINIVRITCPDKERLMRRHVTHVAR